MKRTILSCFVFLLFLNVSFGQVYNGSFSLQTEEASLTLILKEDAGGAVTGSLSSTMGVNYSIQGQVEEGVAMGICSDGQSGVYFEAYLEGSNLTLGLIEADEFNMPDYNTAQYLIFTKQSATPATPGSNPQPTTPNPQPIPPSHQPAPTPNPVPGTPQTESSLSSGDPSWGWNFTPPSGWQSQKSTDGIYLGHNTIAGLIMVLPHMSENMQQLQQEMLRGISEEGNYLSLNGNLESMGNGVLAGEYQGMMNGTQVQARGIGTLSPYGGGAFVIALTTPEKYGDDLKNTAAKIAGSMSYFKTSADEMIKYFAGSWTNYTSHTSTSITLLPDGRYIENYESSYGGELYDGGYWSAAGQSQDDGRWTVMGNKQQGRILVKLNNGNEITYDYKVHVKDGHTYWNEYYFNGYLYGKNR